MRRTVLVLTVAALLLGACGDATQPDRAEPEPAPEPAATGPSADDLDGKVFVSTSLDSPDHTLVPGSTITLRFDGANLGAQAGCNSIGGEYDVVDGALVTGAMAMTEMGCDEPLMAQDAWLSAFLGSRPTLALDGDVLTLAGDGGILEMVEEGAGMIGIDEVPLEGTLWVADTLFSGGGPDGAASSIPQGATISVQVVDGETLQVRTGCNNGRGPVEVDADAGVLRVGPLALTRRACLDGLEDVERTVRQVLEAPTTFELGPRELVLTSSDGSAAIRFVPDAGAPSVQ